MGIERSSRRRAERSAGTPFRLTSSRCQRRSVCGVIMNNAQPYRRRALGRPPLDATTTDGGWNGLPPLLLIGPRSHVFEGRMKFGGLIHGYELVARTGCEVSVPFTMPADPG